MALSYEPWALNPEHGGRVKPKASIKTTTNTAATGTSLIPIIITTTTTTTTATTRSVSSACYRGVASTAHIPAVLLLRDWRRRCYWLWEIEGDDEAKDQDHGGQQVVHWW